MKTIVVSAVNLNKGGTLAILRDCLAYLSALAAKKDVRIVAIVYKRELADFPNIEYVETQWPKKRWVNRLWYEYITLKKISKEIGPVYLWLSLHDTTPNVLAERRAVYCHNSFSFYKWSIHDLFFAPKIALFALFTKYIYGKNIHENNYLVVQQQWFKKAMVDMFKVNPAKVIVAPPRIPSLRSMTSRNDMNEQISSVYTFLYPATADSHKNFQLICQACELLETRWGMVGFQVYLTVSGEENKYTSWLYERWGHLKSLEFIGYLKKDNLMQKYKEVNCLLFPSKVETWGLPITEFSAFNKPMLLADLPYAHETAAGHGQIAFFDPNKAEIVAELMMALIQRDSSVLTEVSKEIKKEPLASSWESLFSLLLWDTKQIVNNEDSTSR